MTQQTTDSSKRGSPTRRTVIKAGLTASAAAVGVSSSGIGMAQSQEELSLYVDAEAETVTITNDGDESVDLTGYQMNFEAGEDSERDQIRALAGEVIIEAGDSVTVATGAGESGDVSLEDPYDGEVLNQDESDVVALLTAEEDVVATSNGTDDGDTGDGGDDDEGDRETHTLTATIVESSDADIVSGEVTVDGETKTTMPESDEDPHIITADFELEDGTYTVSATYDQPDETWESNEQEVEIDGEDENVSLTVYPPDSDERGDDDSDEDGGEGDETDETDDTADSDDEPQDEDQQADDCPEEESEPKNDDCPEEKPEPKEEGCERRQ